MASFAEQPSEGSRREKFLFSLDHLKILLHWTNPDALKDRQTNKRPPVPRLSLF